MLSRGLWHRNRRRFSAVIGGIVFVLLIFGGCRSGHLVRTEEALREALSKGTGTVKLAPGTIEITSEIEIPPGARNLRIVGADGGSRLHLATNFEGRAALVFRSASNVELSGFSLYGHREFVDERVGLPPSNEIFASFYRNNGLVFEDIEQLTITNVHFAQIANFPLLISRGTGVLVEGVTIRDSGSLNKRGRNNSSGGILLEEGTADFVVRRCKLENVLGNGVWTHSRAGSPRARDGVIAENEFRNIGRDAIQVGHATRILVENNQGSRIGYPVDVVDIEGRAYPVGIDTADNTDDSTYLNNHFEEINGKCIDLDGFHHGTVRGNRCTNRGPASDYPLGHFGIIMNNTNAAMISEKIVIEDNVVDGALYGGLFLIGSGHTVRGNRFVRLNLAGCQAGSSDPRCDFSSWPGEPLLLRTGIYLGRRAERPAVTRDNVIENNVISGLGMDTSCIAAAPGLALAENRVRDNRCAGENAPAGR